MEQLFELIRKVEEDEEIEYSEYLDERIDIVRQISNLADDLLITGGGRCNWENMNYLEDRGIHVFPVERDGFGWLIGGIPTRKGVITYG